MVGGIYLMSHSFSCSWDSWGNLLTILFLGVSENWNYIDWHIHMCACLDSEL